MSGHEAPKGEKHKLKITEQVEAGGLHLASAGGGAVTATLYFLSAEAGAKTMLLIGQANEAGLISESGGLSAVEAIKAVGLAYAAFKTGMWSWRTHNLARAVESGTRHTKKGP